MPVSSARAGVSERRCARLLHDTRGASYVEYLIVLGMVALAAQVGLRAFGKSVAGTARSQADTIATIESDCVGGLCIVTTKDAPKNGNQGSAPG